MPRGGARPGAGRKGLTAIEKLLIGNECAQRWGELAKQRAIERHRKLPKTKEIEFEQSRAHLIHKNLRKTSRKNLKDISDSIDEITDGRRHTSIPITRPYGSRTALLQAVVAWCFETYGLQISTSQARESWKKFRQNKELQDEQNEKAR
jgi:hypothetical protein